MPRPALREDLLSRLNPAHRPSTPQRGEIACVRQPKVGSYVHLEAKRLNLGEAI